MDWREVGRERVFPHPGDGRRAMSVAHRNLTELAPDITSAPQEVLGFERDATFVIYVGIGCGAGRVTTFRGSPTILFGLENVAGCGWCEGRSITGLGAHEIWHVAHSRWHAERDVPVGSGPWWQPHKEGFAQRREHVILGEDTWHESTGPQRDGWLD